jgi:hypothetical protein
MRIIAPVAVAAGNTIVNVPAVEDLEPPKSKIATAGLPVAVSLYIMAPNAVMVAVVNDKSAKSVSAVVPEEVGVTLLRVPPPAVYEPEAVTSLVVV